MRILHWYHAPSGSFYRRSILADGTPDPAGDWIEGDVDPDTQYRKSDGTLGTRTAATVTASKSLFLADGADSVTVTCPNPAWLRVNGEFFQVAGTRTVTTTIPGQYAVLLAGQYTGDELVVTAGDEIDLAFDSDPRWQALRTATVAEIDTWLTNNVTNIAQARTVLKLLLLAVRRINR
jgi:hypothetical protein